MLLFMDIESRKFNSMALMKRSNLKGKGPSHKSKSFKKKHNSELKTRSTLTKVKPKRKLTDAVMMVTEEGAHYTAHAAK